MNPATSRKAFPAFTLIELLVVVAIITILIFMILPMRYVPDKSVSVQCMSNLKQVSIGYILWATANTDLFPWEVSTNAGGTIEMASNGDAADHFLAISSFVRNPGVLHCPTDKSRILSTNYSGFNNSNLSYFVSLDASIKSLAGPAITILAGDRHLSLNNQAVKMGLLETSNHAALSWTQELHSSEKSSTRGVLVFVDGHAEVVKAEKLPVSFQRQSIATNRLVIP